MIRTHLAAPATFVRAVGGSSKMVRRLRRRGMGLVPPTATANLSRPASGSPVPPPVYIRARARRSAKTVVEKNLDCFYPTVLEAKKPRRGVRKKVHLQTLLRSHLNHLHPFTTIWTGVATDFCTSAKRTPP
jgi:hypothetical protein